MSCEECIEAKKIPGYQRPSCEDCGFVTFLNEENEFVWNIFSKFGNDLIHERTIAINYEMLNTIVKGVDIENHILFFKAFGRFVKEYYKANSGEKDNEEQKID